MATIAEQRHPTFIATTSALLVVAAFVAAKVARDAILLSRYSIRSLPFFIGVSAALSLPVIIVAGKLMVRHGPARLVPAMNAASGGLALIEFVLLAHYPRPAAVLTFFHLSIMSAVLVSGFWSIVNERFEIDTAKRHIGRIGMGATIGGILGGVIAERSAVYLPHDMILVVIATLQLGCATMLYAFGRGGVRTAATPVEPGQDGTWSALGAVARSALLRNVGLVVVFTAISAGAIDYVFKADLVRSSSSEGLLRALALFYTATNVITAIVQIAICGPIIAKLGVPRSVATLPWAITGFGVVALLVRVPISATIARAAELITRNSVFRAGYELLYAPLPNDQKRPTKVVLDVGADKIGDILAAQLVGAIVFVVADPRTGLLIATLATGAIGLLIAARLPRHYTDTLETGLRAAAAELPLEDGAEPWITLTNMPSLGQPGDVIPLRRRRSRRPVPVVPAPNGTERLLQLVAELRSDDPTRIERALASPLPVEVAPIAIELVGARDHIARLAMTGLRGVAPRCTGLLLDAMLDRTREDSVRRRLPAIVCRGEPRLAAWGLWQGIADPSFEVRYQCSAALPPLALDGHLTHIAEEDVFERVRMELIAGPADWKAYQPVRDPVLETSDDDLHADIGLAYVFHVLGLVLPAEPLWIALRAVQTDDASLRGMALEYLESILPPDVHARLWPLLDRDPDGAERRSTEQLLTRLNLTYPSILEKLKQRHHH